MLQLEGYRSLLIAMADAGHSLPSPSDEEIAAQLKVALPLLRDALEKRRPTVLDPAIPDSGPLITFGLLDRLNLLDRFNCPILVTDMVSEEILRGPDAAKDKVVFEKWLGERGNRIQTVETTYGAMWKELTPDARKRVKRLHPYAGELSIREFTDTLRDTIPEEDQVLVLFEEHAVAPAALNADTWASSVWPSALTRA